MAEGITASVLIMAVGRMIAQNGAVVKENTIISSARAIFNYFRYAVSKSGSLSRNAPSARHAASAAAGAVGMEDISPMPFAPKAG